MRVVALSGSVAIFASAAAAAQAADPGAILRGTPWWVYPLLALLVLLGLQATRPRLVSLQRLAIVPLLFIGWGVATLATRAGGSAVLPAAWFAAAGVGALLGRFATRFDGVRVDRGLLQLPGSWLPLARNLALFMAKYGLAAAAAIEPARAGALAPWDAGVSGLSAGFFAVWLVRLVGIYRRARQGEGSPVPSADLIRGNR